MQAIEFKILETETQESNSYTKSFNQIKLALTDAEKKWIISVIDGYDQQSFKHFKQFRDHFLYLEGVYSFHIFFHKKKITISKLKNDYAIEAEKDLILDLVNAFKS
jgi:hypothetical protein